MGYQALLFCPDEKTARTVTQVLSELDFAVIPCTEPFAAVKKLMGEHFDAVVVDCDNEQNATLLFKSARNSPNNHSSLAVAVVEGQAGVAKAFRIGANLVLTKPVNVEQAKGTLRVARGLLRKSEAAKTVTGAASAAAKPAPPVPAPPKPAPQRIVPTVSTAGAAAPITPSVAMAAASSSTQKPAPQAKIVASVPSEISKTDSELFEAGSEEVALPPVVEVASEAKVAASQPGIVSPTAGHLPKSGWVGTGAASAPAPAREPKTSAATEGGTSTVIPEPESPVEKVAAAGTSSSVEETSAPATSFTLGGNVGRRVWRTQKGSVGSGCGCAGCCRWLRSMVAMGTLGRSRNRSSFRATGEDYRQGSASSAEHGSERAGFRGTLFCPEFDGGYAGNRYARNRKFGKWAISPDKAGLWGEFWSRLVHACSFGGGGEQSSKHGD